MNDSAANGGISIRIALHIAAISGKSALFREGGTGWDSNAMITMNFKKNRLTIK
jgi:hypothetical protein